jgi:hypothetical protein
MNDVIKDDFIFIPSHLQNFEEEIKDIRQVILSVSDINVN